MSMRRYITHDRLREEDGQTLVEYALIAVFVSIVAVVIMAAIGFDTLEFLDPVENALGLGDEEAPVPAGDDDAAAAPAGN